MVTANDLQNIRVRCSTTELHVSANRSLNIQYTARFISLREYKAKHQMAYSRG